MPGPIFPVHDFELAEEHLKRPFAPAALRFKVQATWPKGDPKNGLIVSYMDARLVSARLNHVAGGDWSHRFAPWGTDVSAALCELTVFGITRADVGKASGGIEREKAAVSDALKRAAVHFGIGAYLYSLKAVTLGGTQNGAKREGVPTLIVKGRGDKKTLAMTDACETYLRHQYTRWLDSEANVWGEALDHHDEPGAIGDPVEREPTAEADLELAAAKQEADTFYSQQNGTVRKALKPGIFKAKLEAASDVEAVETLMGEVKALAA